MLRDLLLLVVLPLLRLSLVLVPCVTPWESERERERPWLAVRPIPVLEPWLKDSVRPIELPTLWERVTPFEMEWEVESETP